MNMASEDEMDNVLGGMFEKMEVETSVLVQDTMRGVTGKREG